MNPHREVIIALVALRLTVINTEWIQIAQTSSGINREHGLALAHSAILDHIYSRKDLKYEDLEEVIGPGFEEDFAKFLKAQKGNDSDTPLLAFDGSEFGDGDDFDAAHSVFSLGRPKFFNGNNEMSVKNSSIKVSTYANETLQSVLIEDQRKFDHVDDKVSSVGELDENQAENANATQSNDPDKNSEKKKIILKMVRVKSAQHPFSFAAVLKFLKSIQQTLVADATGGIKNKIKSLETFKNQLFLNIRERLSALWPTKVDRSKRDIWGSHGHGMSLASSEVSLITIAFLTFAVFLIKLVLQVINTIKNKSYSFNGFDTYSSNIRPLKIVANNQNARKFSLNEDTLSEFAPVLASTESNKNIQ